MAFEGFVCWKQEDLNDIAVIDAASSDDAVFIATHQPLRILKQFDSTRTVGESISEADLLEEFSSPVGNDPQVFVLTGETGTGKSHLVRWLYLNSRGQETWHQVYIPKRDTSLRRVITNILSDLSGPNIDELRRKLEEARTSVRDLEEAKSKILDELAHLMEFPTNGVEGLNLAEEDTRRLLKDVLHDPVIRPDLLKEDGAIHRITQLGMERLRPDEDESRLFIREEDLPSTPRDLVNASVLARNGIAKLNQSQSFRDIAVRVLNDELAHAKKAVFVGRGIDLLAVFDEVRVELAKRHCDLVLYIEDLVLLHGIDRELAQVFTQARSSDDRCGMRIVIAVTTGYLDKQGLNTLQDRARHYSLDLRLGSDVPDEDSEEFVARYLNAARLGKRGLERLYKDSKGSNWLTNQCSSCDYREECHDAFGSSKLGYGFYPLNRNAIDRLTKLIGSRTEAKDHFDPRSVVRAVIRDPLTLAVTELETRQFPSSHFAADLDPTRSRIRPELRYEISGLPNAEQHLSLLTYWASSSGTVDRYIYKAFRIPFVDVQIGPGPEQGTPEDVVIVTKPEEDAESRNLDDWANDKALLTASLARSIRQLVRDAVAMRLRTGPYGVRVSGQARDLKICGVPFSEECVRIAGAQGGGEVARVISLEIERSDPNLVLIKQLLAAKRTKSWTKGGIGNYLIAQERIDEWAEQVLRAVDGRTVDLDSALNLLAVTSQPAVSVAQSLSDCLSEILAARLDAEGRSKAWGDFAKKVQRARTDALLQIEWQLTASKGDGAPGILDVAPIASALEANRDRFVLEINPIGSDFVSNWDQLVALQERTSREEWERVMKLTKRCRKLVDSRSSWQEVSSQISRVVEKGAAMGKLPRVDSKADLEEKRVRVPESAVEQLDHLERLETIGASDLWKLRQDPCPSLEALATYLEQADLLLSELDKVTRQEDRDTESIGIGEVTREMRGLADDLQFNGSGNIQ